MYKKISYLFLFLLFALFALSCDFQNTNVVLKVEATNITLEEGKEHTINPTFDGAYTLIIEASNDNVVIDGMKIKAVKEGETVVTLYLKEFVDVKVTINVKVEKAKEAQVTEYKLVKIVDGKEEEITFTDSKEVTLENLEKEGFVFIGWFSGDELVKTLENKNYILEAKFERIKFNLSYQIDENNVEDSEFFYGDDVTLFMPEKEGYIFLGWYEGEKKIEKLENKDYYLVAKWEEKVKEYTISYDLNGGKCDNLVYTFKEGDKVVLPKPVKDGCDFAGWYEGDELVETIENKDYSLTAHFIEVTPYIEVYTLDGKTEYYLDDQVQLFAKVHPESLGEEVIWKADIATKKRGTISEDGKVNIISSGILTFKVQSKKSSKVSTTIDINILDFINPDRLMDTINNQTVVTQQMRVYDSNTGYEYTLVGSICNYLFEDLKINENLVPVGSKNRPGTSCNGNNFSCRFVAVHEVGASGTAINTSNYCKTNGSTSWHFTVGNDGVYQQLPLNEVGFHAGDGTYTALEYIDTGIKAPFGDNTPAKITINQVTGNFEVNGQEIDVKAPLRKDGKIVLNSQLPYTGITNYVNANGNYMMANTHWDDTYQTLANYGGNLSSIGIETCVNQGSDIYRTWQLCAKLIGSHIMQEKSLVLDNIKQHNTFSGKDCPQSIRKANRWETFMSLVTFEYNIQKYFLSKGYTIELICDNKYVASNGKVKELPEYETKVEYQVRLKSSDGSFDKTYEYQSIIPAKK